jgi:hypothetical protein
VIFPSKTWADFERITQPYRQRERQLLIVTLAGPMVLTDTDGFRDGVHEVHQRFKEMYYLHLQDLL